MVEPRRLSAVGEEISTDDWRRPMEERRAGELGSDGGSSSTIATTLPLLFRRPGDAPAGGETEERRPGATDVRRLGDIDLRRSAI